MGYYMRISMIEARMTRVRLPQAPGIRGQPERGFRRGGVACAQAPYAGPWEKISRTVALFQGGALSMIP